MTISINWETKVITVPQTYLTFISGSLYELNVNQFRLDLKDIEDSEDGMIFPDTHRHNTEVTLSGVTYARTLEIINGYTITFEEVGSPYRVRCVGANHNISDVQNLNNVSIIVGNAAGLVVTETGESSDPWLTNLPGSYTGNQAGNILGTEILRLHQFVVLNELKKKNN